MTKICTKCFCEKRLLDFYAWKSGVRAGGLKAECKVCAGHARRLRYAGNRQAVLTQCAKYRKENLDKVRQSAKKSTRQWRLKNLEKAQQYGRAYIKKRRKELGVVYLQRQREYQKQYREQNPNFKMAQNIRNNTNRLLKFGAAKTSSALSLLGCSVPELWRHLEKLFQPGMTRNNHGQGPGKWNIDHVRPCASFSDLNCPEQQKQCFHYTNLQPLWSEDNLRKGASYRG